MGMRTERTRAALLALALAIAAGAAMADVHVYTEPDGTLVFTDRAPGDSAGESAVGPPPAGKATVLAHSQATAVNAGSEEGADGEAREYMEAYERALAEGGD